MKITSVDVFGYDVRYAHGEYVMSKGRAATHELGTLVRLRTDEGLDGWGEITPLGGTYLPTFTAGIRSALEILGHAVFGQDPTNLSRVARAMDAALLGQNYAKSAIDIACWDLLGKATGKPVSVLLGGVLNDDFPLYEAVPLGAPGAMADFVAQRAEAGIRRFQLKVGNDPLDDVARAKATRAVASDDTIIIADSNGGWSILDAQIALHQLDDVAVYIEQPCRTTDDCMIAMRGSRLPLVLDESIVTATDVFHAKHDAHAASINIKISRVGGLTRAARMRDLMQDLNLKVSIEDMWGGDIITAAVSHIAASTRQESLLMVSFFNDWTDGHVAGYEPRSLDGRGSAPTAPGLGITVDAAALGAPLFSV
ncbi:mandelate racemase/muconate lactonizing enzyme family protein [Parafrigoribacterium mesophilum]|uniref:mandelate racemase/muconate lactonizing enzyme family protein n=1 Tax=Parafrigoribacterium mesophilum TaxID=433646 RepID=UPI0031FD72EB